MTVLLLKFFERGAVATYWALGASISELRCALAPKRGCICEFNSGKAPVQTGRASPSSAPCCAGAVLDPGPMALRHYQVAQAGTVSSWLPSFSESGPRFKACLFIRLLDWALAPAAIAGHCPVFTEQGNTRRKPQDSAFIWRILDTQADPEMKHLQVAALHCHGHGVPW